MLNLNDTGINAEGGNFDPSKIFGFECVQDGVITGFVENVTICGFDTGTSQNGNAYWDIMLKDSKGNESNHREYDIDQSREGWEKKQASQLKRIKHILTKFVPEGTQLPQANTFPELWAAVQQILISAQCNTKPMRLKMVYNNKGFLTVPAYVPFLEPMSIGTNESKLKLTDFDTTVRPQADNPASAGAGNAFAGDATQNSGESLPFNFN